MMIKTRLKRAYGLAATCLAILLLVSITRGVDLPERTLELPPSEDNPRNSEGAFVTLKDGRVLFVYTHFTGGGGDHSAAHLAGRTSSDGGRTWTKEDQVIVKNEGGMNVMSVSLLRLQNNNIALFYLLKNSGQDCRPVMRLSKDEGATWGEPVMCITDEVGYYVLNNDRVIQLEDGRLVAPVCLHWPKGAPKADWQGTLMCYLSDDNGKSWQRSKSAQKTFDAAGKRVTTQEPGVIELKDGRVMMFIRTNAGCQYLSYSSDGGDTWSAPVASGIKSPVSPASIKRLPSTGDLLLVWNDHANIHAGLKSRRVPLSTAISKDDGKTWQCVKVLEGNPKGRYCYIAIHPVDDVVLLGYCAMSGLAHSRITRVPVSWLYEDAPKTLPVQQLSLLFKKAATGPFERLETTLGIWSAAAGHAEVYTSSLGKGLRLQGGEDRTVTLTLPQASFCAPLLAALGVERFTVRTPYRLIVEAKTGDGWKKVWEQGENTTVAQLHKIEISDKTIKTTQLRFRCTSVLGAIIGEMTDVYLNGYFKD